MVRLFRIAVQALLYAMRFGMAEMNLIFLLFPVSTSMKLKLLTKCIMGK